MNKPFIFVLLFISIIFSSNAQVMNQRETFLVSTNILKLAYAVPNIEVEYYILNSVSAQLCSEYVLGHWVIKSENHPDLVSRLGFRYHVLHAKEQGAKNDPYFGIYGGYSWSKDYPTHTTPNLGIDFGYKYQFNDCIFINAKGLVTYKLNDSKVLPGIECLLGYVF
jgi:hypothetical protein